MFAHADEDEMQNVREFARRFRLSIQEKNWLLDRFGVSAPRLRLLADARRVASQSAG